MFRFIDAGPMFEHIEADTEFIAFDMETTGLDPIADRITEIGAVRFTRDGIAAVFGSLVDPGRPIHPDAVRVSGITDEMVRGQPDIRDVLGPFEEFSAGLPLVAHNAPFDASFLREALRRAGRRLWPNPVIDTRLLAKALWPRFPGFSLARVREALGLPPTAQHRGLEDAQACREVFLEGVKQLREELFLPEPVRTGTVFVLSENNVDEAV